jgi:hypothetical protein
MRQYYREMDGVIYRLVNISALSLEIKAASLWPRSYRQASAWGPVGLGIDLLGNCSMRRPRRLLLVLYLLHSPGRFLDR